MDKLEIDELGLILVAEHLGISLKTLNLVLLIIKVLLTNFLSSQASS